MIKTFIFAAILLLLFSCSKTTEQNAADNFMISIINNIYNNLFLPNLEPEHISTLLKYSDNKTIIKNPVINPISSFFPDSVTVGYIALWTIESIRITEITSNTSEFDRFPSLAPMVRCTNNIHTNRFILQDTVSQLYKKWWNNEIPTLQKLQVSPLSNTTFFWI